MESVAPDEYRHASVTLRCLEDDFGFQEVPPPEILSRTQLDHPLIAELTRLAPTTPQGQKPIRALHDRSFQGFRLRAGQWRGCSFHDRDANPTTVWLCAGELRRDGDSEDAYEHFLRLLESDRLAPTGLDSAVAAVEEFVWYVIPESGKAAYEVVRAAIDNPDTTFASSDPTLPVAVVAYVVEDGSDGIAELSLGIQSARTATDLGTEIIHARLLHHVSERLGASTNWEEGFDVRLPRSMKHYRLIVDLI